MSRKRGATPGHANPFKPTTQTRKYPVGFSVPSPPQPGQPSETSLGRPSLSCSPKQEAEQPPLPKSTPPKGSGPRGATFSAGRMRLRQAERAARGPLKGRRSPISRRRADPRGRGHIQATQGRRKSRRSRILTTSGPSVTPPGALRLRRLRAPSPP